MLTSNRTQRQTGIMTLLALLLATAALAQTATTSTEEDQKELAVTVYNSNVALVRDVRRIKLPGRDD